MSTLFEVLAHTDAAEQERISGNRAIIAAQTRVKDRFEKFVANSVNVEDRAARLGLLDDEIREVVAAVSEEYGYEGEPETIYLAATAVLGGGHAADCTCGFCKNKGKLPGTDDEDQNKESRVKQAKTCPECEKAQMHEDDHVWICPKCGYETSEPDDDDDDDYKESRAKRAADYPGHDYSIEDGEYVKDWNPEEDQTPAKSKDESSKDAWHNVKTANKYIEQRDGKWVITQKGTGKVLSTHDSEEKAEAAFRAMEMHKHEGSLDLKTASMFDFVPDFVKEADGFSFCECNCDGCDTGNHCESDQCISTKHSGNPGNHSGDKTAASPETRDTFVTETLDLPSSKDGLSDVGSPKIDKKQVPGGGGVPGADGLDLIDVPSKQHPTETQDIHETPDYWADPTGTSETGKSIDAQKPLAPAEYAADNTTTWTGTKGQAAPVTETALNAFSSKLAKWQIVT